MIDLLSRKKTKTKDVEKSFSENTGTNLAMNETVIKRPTISYKSGDTRKSTMKTVKGSEQEKDKAGIEHVGQINLPYNRVLEIGKSKNGSKDLVFGFATNPNTYDDRAVVENKACTKNVSGDVTIESQDSNFKDGAEALKTNFLTSTDKIVERISEGCVSKDTKINQVLPFLENSDDIEEIESLQKLKDSSMNNKSIEEEVIEKKNKLELKRQKERELKSEIQNAVEDFKNHKSFTNSYILYLQKKWNQLIYLYNDKGELTNELQEAMLSLYSSLLSFEQVSRELRRQIGIQTDAETILKGISGGIRNFENTNETKLKEIFDGENCIAIFIKKAKIRVDQKDNVVYVIFGYFLIDGSTKIAEVFLGLYFENGEILDTWKKVYLDLSKKGIKKANFLVTSEEIIKDLKLHTEFIFEDYLIDLFDVFKDFIEFVNLKIKEFDKDFKEYIFMNDDITRKNKAKEIKLKWQDTCLNNFLNMSDLSNYESMENLVNVVIGELESDVLTFCRNKNVERSFIKEWQDKWKSTKKDDVVIKMLTMAKTSYDAFISKSINITLIDILGIERLWNMNCIFDLPENINFSRQDMTMIIESRIFEFVDNFKIV